MRAEARLDMGTMIEVRVSNVMSSFRFTALLDPPSDRGENVGEASLVGDPPSAKSKRLWMDGRVHFEDSIGGDGGDLA